MFDNENLTEITTVKLQYLQQPQNFISDDMLPEGIRPLSKCQGSSKGHLQSYDDVIMTDHLINFVYVKISKKKNGFTIFPLLNK